MKHIYALIFLTCVTGMAIAQDYQLVWSDEFNGLALNTNAWNIEINGDGGGNNELQYYCEKGVSVQNGNLVITATRENYMGKSFTSGRINSKHKLYFKHGKIESSIKLPSTANGLWPAFWMMGNDIDNVGWPRCGEIDVLEMGNAEGIKNGTQDRFFNGACHWGFYNNQGQYPNYGLSSTWDYSLQDGNYHTFTCFWDETKVRMYVDYDEYPTRNPYYEMGLADSEDAWATGKYFHKPFFILFNLAVGGNFPAIWEENDITALNNSSRSMYIDWVRVYQSGAADEELHLPESQDIMNAMSDYQEEKAQKILYNGQLFIRRGDKTYTITGQIAE